MKKNGTILVGVSLIVVVIIIFYTNGKVKTNPQAIKGYDSLMLYDFENDSPQNPTDLIIKNNSIIKYLFGDEVIEQEIEKIIVLERNLFAQDLIDINSETVQIQNVSDQVNLNKENEVKISDIEVYPPEYPEQNNNSICIVRTKHYMTKGGNVYRTYTLIKENNMNWKIYNWADSSKDFPTVEALKK